MSLRRKGRKLEGEKSCGTENDRVGRREVRMRVLRQVVVLLEARVHLRRARCRTRTRTVGSCSVDMAVDRMSAVETRVDTDLIPSLQVV